MRKLFTSILAIIVLVLSCIPCNDADAMPIKQGVAAVIKSAPLNHCPAGGDAAHVCSPFCTCSCCAGFALPVNQMIELNQVVLYTQKVFAVYNSQQMSDVFLPIWQPPQIG